MTTLIKNGFILPMTDKNDSRKADILLEGSKIKDIGKDITGSFDRVIDAESKIVLPSFVNAHTHLAMVLMRNFKDDNENLQQWLSEIWPIEAKLSDDDVYWASKLALAELIKNGCTTFADMYFHPWQSARAVRESKVRGILGIAIIGDDKEAERCFREYVPRIEDAADGYAKIRIDAAPHAIYTCTDKAYIRAASWAKENGAFLNTHIAETEKEVTDSIKSTGLRPIEYLDKLGVLDGNAYLSHGVFLSEKELSILKEKNIAVVHNPVSNAKLASGIAPITEYKKKGINVALGTDGASSNNNLNMLFEMRIASLLSSASTKKPSQLSCYEIIKMATINGAKALGLDEKIGTIEKGKDADLIIMDLDKANTAPGNDPYSAVVFSSDERNIEYVFSSGHLLLDKGELTTLDEDEAVKNVKRQWKDLLGR